MFRTNYFDKSTYLLMSLSFMFACNLANIWFWLAIRQDLKQRKESCKHLNLDIKHEVLRLLPQVHQAHLIVDDDPHVFPPCRTLLHHAARCGWLDICRTLVEDYDCNPLGCNDEGWSVLHIACWNGFPPVVKYLVTLKSVSATVSDRNRYGHTFMELVHVKKYEILSLLAPHVQLNMELHVNAVFPIFIAGN